MAAAQSQSTPLAFCFHSVHREPVHRMLSHMDFMLFCYTRHVTPYHDAYLEGRDMAFWKIMAPAPLDNYMTR